MNEICKHCKASCDVKDGIQLHNGDFCCLTCAEEMCTECHDAISEMETEYGDHLCHICLEAYLDSKRGYYEDV